MVDDVPGFSIASYPVYTVLAEKLEAINKLGMANSRMKDYFDIHVIINSHDLDNALLERAITNTFERRHSPHMDKLPVGLTKEYYENPLIVARWKGFLTRNGLEEIQFKSVVSAIAE